MADQHLSAAAEALSAGWFHGPAALSALGDGHINDTWLATDPAGGRFVLQRLNRRVFPDPGRVMGNLRRVLNHLSAAGAGLTAELLGTRGGEDALVDHEGDWWRLWRYVEGGRSLERTADPALCAAAGAAFGRFQRLLSDLPPPPLEPSIPGFLELDGYLARLDEVMGGQPEAEEELLQAGGSPAFLDAHRVLGGSLAPRKDLIHGDCKLNNLLFAGDSAKVLAVLDLDTVMHGHWAWDFGDLARSVLVGCAEPAAYPGLFSALCRGFVQGSGRRPPPGDLVLAPRYIAFMLGVRFLTDHLQGDRYFKVREPGDNRRRAWQQFDLLKRLARLEEDFRRAAEAAVQEAP